MNTVVVIKQTGEYTGEVSYTPGQSPRVVISHNIIKWGIIAWWFPFPIRRNQRVSVPYNKLTQNRWVSEHYEIGGEMLESALFEFCESICEEAGDTYILQFGEFNNDDYTNDVVQLDLVRSDDNRPVTLADEHDRIEEADNFEYIAPDPIDQPPSYESSPPSYESSPPSYESSPSSYDSGDSGDSGGGGCDD